MNIINKIKGKIKELLKWSKGNAKKNYYSFSLPAGKSCPSAFNCLAFVEIVDDKRIIKDSKFAEFRCYSASDEVRHTNVYNQRKHNFDLLKSCKTVDEIYNLLDASIPKIKFSPFRVHDSGDFFNQMYFDAWLKIAVNNPDCLYYAYTKSLNYWVERLDKIPNNFKLVASYGGRHDHLIKKHNLISAIVVNHPSKAEELNLKIDHDDSLAIKNNENFALLLHGVQPKNSKSSKALSRMRREKIEFSYPRK